MVKKVKKITLSWVLSWIFGILFLLAGIGAINQGFHILGILIILCSVMIIPYFNKVIAEKFHFEISGGIKFTLVIIIFILIGFTTPQSSEFKTGTSDVIIIQPTEEVEAGITSNKTQIQPKTTLQEQPKQKIKSATLTIDRIQVQVANLYPTRVTVTNTGDIVINPKFDIYVYDSNGNEICSGSPLFNGFGNIDPGKKKTDEISIMGCMFEEDGTYSLKIDLLDSDYNKLDSKTREFTVNYWSKFRID